MAGDEDRPPAEPQAHAEEAAAEIPAAEPSMATGAADLAAPAGRSEPFAPRATASYGEAEPATQPAAPARSIMPTVLAIIGVVLVLLLAANLYTLYNPPGNDAIPALQSAVAAQKQQIATLESRPPVDLAPLQDRLTGLADDMTPLKAAVASNAEAAKAGTDAKAAIGPLSGQVADLGKGLSGVQAAVAALPKVDLGPTDEKVAAMQSRLAATETKVGTTEAKLADTDKRLVPLEAYFNAPKTTAQVTQERQNGSAAETRAAPLAVIAEGVLDDLATGHPFPTKTKALARLGVDAATLAPLDAVATTGAATDQDLLAGFAGAEDGIVVAAAPVSTGTMFDRMMANAQSLVKVSRTGAGPGEGADAIASRVVAALRAGSLPAAAAEWDKLPDASRARSAAWGARLKARIAAEAAARSIASKAVDALAAAQ